ncbi:guanylate-binding protein 3-like [Chelonoidis abingdonii]|uniref:guanylate-binding protein 3-like n=1 Tax=Chelonoidis abingdonii TaxID=106734 RepID=UPI003F4967E1
MQISRFARPDHKPLFLFATVEHCSAQWIRSVLPFCHSVDTPGDAPMDCASFVASSMETAISMTFCKGDKVLEQFMEKKEEVAVTILSAENMQIEEAKCLAGASENESPDEKKETDTEIVDETEGKEVENLPVTDQFRPGPMASETLMEEPMWLIQNSTGGSLQVNPQAVKILEGITQPVVVVAIVGMYRTGKSYLMNSLAGKRKGFSMGSTIQSHTKGIWMWCVPHPGKPDHTLVLLDTEGLADVEKGDPKHDTWIFTLAVLLSSTLVYNSKGTIDQDSMNKLHFVSELSEHIKVKADVEEEDDSAPDTEYISFFPNFIWTVRDFTLDLEIDGKEVTEDEYLEKALMLKKVFGMLAQSYMDSIASGKVPCLEDAVTTLATKENEVAIRESLAYYMGQMEEQVVFPVEVAVLSEIHGNCKKAALQLYMQRSFKDEDQKHQKQLATKINEHYATVLSKNKNTSQEICQTLLVQLSADMEKKLRDGVYMQPGGHELYMKDQKQVLESFQRTPKKGVMAEQVLEQFMDSKKTEADTIVTADKMLTDVQKHLAAEKARGEQLEQQFKAEEERRQQLEQRMRDVEHSHQENIRQMEAKMEEENTKMRQEMDRTIECKLKEQEKLLQQGFSERARELQEEMDRLQKQGKEREEKLQQQLHEKHQQEREEKEKQRQHERDEKEKERQHERNEKEKQRQHEERQHEREEKEKQRQHEERQREREEKEKQRQHEGEEKEKQRQHEERQHEREEKEKQRQHEERQHEREEKEKQRQHEERQHEREEKEKQHQYEVRQREIEAKEKERQHEEHQRERDEKEKQRQHEREEKEKHREHERVENEKQRQHEREQKEKEIELEKTKRSHCLQS